MAEVSYLLDKSAWVRAPKHPAVTTRIAHLLRHGNLSLCTVTALEILYSARNADEYRRDRDRLSTFAWVELADPRRAIDLQSALADRGWHRTSIPDVIIAATAAEHGLTVLHYDSDFERLTDVAGGHHEWVVPRGEAN